MDRTSDREQIGEIREGLTFDDVLLVPSASEVLPPDVDLKTRLTREIELNTPLISAAMDTVTEHETAICMARNGGIGIVHKNLSPEDQAAEVDKVKRSESGMIVDPITMRPEQPIREALEVMSRFRISGVPVTRDGKAVGILTNRDLRFVKDVTAEISTVMTQEGLVTVPPGTNMERARELLHAHRIEKLLVVDEAGDLCGLITIKDIEKTERYPDACKDDFGRLRCGAAIGVGPDRLVRAQALVDAGVDVIIVDTAHGHSAGVLETIRELKGHFPELSIVGGNVATAEGTEALIKAGVSGVKVGVRARLDLHDPRDRGRGRASVYGYSRRLQCGREVRDSRDRGRRHQVFGRRREGPRRGGLDDHDRLSVRRHRRVAGRDRSVPGPLLQGLPRYGLPGRDGGGQPRPIFPGRSEQRQTRARRHRGPGALPGQPLPVSPPALRRTAVGHIAYNSLIYKEMCYSVCFLFNFLQRCFAFQKP